MKKQRWHKIMSLVLVFLMMLSSTVTVNAVSENPVLINSDSYTYAAANPDVSDIKNITGLDVCDNLIKAHFDENTSGTYSKDGFTVKVTVTTGPAISWESNYPVQFVFVKGGNQGGNLYMYDPMLNEGTGLATADNINKKTGESSGPAGLSHIVFYYCKTELEPATSSIKVVKTLANTEDEPHVGVRFTLTLNDEEVANKVTGSDGIIEFTGLTIGQVYTLTETIASGYTTDLGTEGNGILDVTVVEDETIINVLNTPPTVDEEDNDDNTGGGGTGGGGGGGNNDNEEPEPTENEITTFDEEPLPEAVPDPEPKPENPNKPDTPNNDKTIELDEEPLAQAIPQTGGIPIEALSFIGVALTGIGAVLRKKDS